MTRTENDLPPQLTTSVPGTFAQSTIVERKPEIIRRVIADNGYPEEIVAALREFAAEIAARPLTPLPETAADAPLWNGELAGHVGRSWLEQPWFLAETYFYRRLLEAVRYFEPGPWQGRDPFGPQKRQEEARAVERLASGLADLEALGPDDEFVALLHSCLWGNRADLSNFTLKAQARIGLAAEAERHLILVDHTDAVHELLAAGARRVDFVNDNAGTDLLFDLVLADLLLTRGWAHEIVFHLKDRPFFVSDAMPADARALIVLLRTAQSAGARALGERLEAHRAAGRLFLRENPFWATCLMYRRLPPELRANLEQADLVILKGDVNYRRLLDDRDWPYTTPLEVAADGFPRPFLALRTLKADLMAGLQPGQAEAAAAEDASWLIDGKRGVIHLVR